MRFTLRHLLLLRLWLMMVLLLQLLLPLLLPREGGEEARVRCDFLVQVDVRGRGEQRQ